MHNNLPAHLFHSFVARPLSVHALHDRCRELADRRIPVLFAVLVRFRTRVVLGLEHEILLRDRSQLLVRLSEDNRCVRQLEVRAERRGRVPKDEMGCNTGNKTLFEGDMYHSEIENLLAGPNIVEARDVLCWVNV